MLTWLKVELLKLLVVNGLLLRLTLEVRITLMCYLLLRSRPKLSGLLTVGTREKAMRLERVGA